MSSIPPPGVIKGEFTFSPKADVSVAEVKAAVAETLNRFAAPTTDVDVSAEYR